MKQSGNETNKKGHMVVLLGMVCICVRPTVSELFELLL